MCRMCNWNSFCRSIGFPMVMGFTHTVVYGVDYITSEELSKAMDTHFYGDKEKDENDAAISTTSSPKLVILDARRTDEYYMSHIHHATNIHSTFFRGQKMRDDMLDRLKGVDKDAIIVLYCAVGLRSSWLAKYLTKLDYTNVKVLYHGYYNWANEGRPIYTRYPPDQILKRHEEHEFQKLHPPDAGIHQCTNKCYPTARVLPQHWIAALVLDSKLASRLPFPKYMYGDHIISKELKAEVEKKEKDEEIKEVTEEKEEEKTGGKKKNKGIFGLFRPRDKTGASVEPPSNTGTDIPLDDIRNTAPQSDLTPDPETIGRDDLLAAQRNKMKLDKEMDTEEIIQKIDKHAHFDPDAEQVLRRRKRVSRERPIMAPSSLVGLPAN